MIAHSIKPMHRISVVIFLLLISVFSAFAREGMWLPFLLKSLNEAEMKSIGMKMSAEDIYGVNQFRSCLGRHHE